MKSSVYIETSIISYLTARLSNDLRVAANQKTTIEWWENRRLDFDLFVSEFVITEAGFGDPVIAKKRLEIIADLSELLVDDSAKMLVKILISQKAIPLKAEIDAYHIAVAAVNGIDIY